MVLDPILNLYSVDPVTATATATATVGPVTVTVGPVTVILMMTKSII